MATNLTTLVDTTLVEEKHELYMQRLQQSLFNVYGPCLLALLEVYFLFEAFSNYSRLVKLP